MCITEIYRDRFPNGVETEFRQLKHCQYGRPGWPCANHRTMENTVRKINFGEPTSEMMLTRAYTPPRPSHRPESIVEVLDESPRRERRKKHRSSLLMSTFFGPTPSPSPHRRRHHQERVVVVDTPPNSPPVRVTRTPPVGGMFGEYGMPSTPPPYIRDASPRRGRRAESITINLDRRRSTSTEAVIHAESTGRSRSPSPATLRAQLRQEEQDEERARERRRDERLALLAAERQIKRDRERRARQHALEDAEIMARPAVTAAPRLLRQRMRPVVEQSDRLNEMFGGLNLGSTGQRVVADALEAADRRERLRRRFSDAGRPAPRRHGVLYDDGRFRYEG